MDRIKHVTSLLLACVTANWELQETNQQWNSHAQTLGKNPSTAIITPLDVTELNDNFAMSFYRLLAP
jgi:hypothetical protein